MKNTLSPRSNKYERGASLVIVVLLAMIVLGGLLVMTSNLALSSHRTTTEQKRNIPAQLAAESGLAYAKAKLDAAQKLFQTNFGVPVDDNGKATLTGTQLTQAISMLCASQPNLPLTGTYSNTTLNLSNKRYIVVPNSQKVCDLTTISPAQAAVFATLMPSTGKILKGSPEPLPVNDTYADYNLSSANAADFFSDVFSSNKTINLGTSNIAVKTGFQPIALLQISTGNSSKYTYRMYFNPASLDSKGTNMDSSRRITMNGSDKINYVDFTFTTEAAKTYAQYGLYVDNMKNGQMITYSTNANGRVHVNVIPNFGSNPTANIKLEGQQAFDIFTLDGFFTSASCAAVDYKLADPCVAPYKLPGTTKPLPQITFVGYEGNPVNLSSSTQLPQFSATKSFYPTAAVLNKINNPYYPNYYFTANATVVTANTKLPYQPPSKPGYNYTVSNKAATLAPYQAYGVSDPGGNFRFMKVLDKGSNTMQPDFGAKFLPGPNDQGTEQIAQAANSGISLPAATYGDIKKLSLYPSADLTKQIIDITPGATDKSRFVLAFDSDNKMYIASSPAADPNAGSGNFSTPSYTFVPAVLDSKATSTGGWRAAVTGEKAGVFNGILYIEGTIRSLSGPKRDSGSVMPMLASDGTTSTKPATTSFTAMTIVTSGNVILTGDLLYKDRCPTKSTDHTTSEGRMIDCSAKDGDDNYKIKNKLGLYLLKGSIYLPYDKSKYSGTTSRATKDLVTVDTTPNENFVTWQNTDPANPAAPSNIYLDAFIVIAEGRKIIDNSGSFSPTNYEGSIYYAPGSAVAAPTFVVGSANPTPDASGIGAHGVINVYGSLGVRTYLSTGTNVGKGPQGWLWPNFYWDARGVDSPPPGFPTLASSSSTSTLDSAITSWSGAVGQLNPAANDNNTPNGTPCDPSITAAQGCTGLMVKGPLEITLNQELIQGTNNQ